MPTTTLAAAITASQTTITVASASGFPDDADVRVRIDDEDMTVTGGQGTTTWTVTRGVNSTTAASHVISRGVSQDDAGTSGELSWNATTKTLTVTGTIYIDGSAKISNSALNTVQRTGDALPLGHLPTRTARSARRSPAAPATSRVGIPTTTC